jgi:two-component system, OmpR family, sensor histidine kinase MtrB
VDSGTGLSPDRAEAGSDSLPTAYLDQTDVLTAPAKQLQFRLPTRLAGLHLGLRSRASTALGLGALLISIAVALLTYVVARDSLVADRRTVIEKLVFANALAAQNSLADSGGDLANFEAVVRKQNGPELDLESIVISNGQTFVSRDNTRTNDVPTALRTQTRAGARGEAFPDYGYQITRVDGTSYLVIGVPMPAVRAEFYGVASLRAVEKRLRNLGRTLAVATLLTSAGAAFVGRTVSRRLMRPLADIATAASGITSGRLDTRLELTGDRDLDPLLRSFNEMAGSLQSRIEREARFASDVSHELRTPLTALVTAARLLDGRRDELSDRSQKTLDVLVTQTTHFERLVLDLLEMSRFDAGAATLHGERVNFVELIRQVASLNESTAHIEVDGLDPVEVGVDKRRVERMVANLLQNAANYAGGATTIRIWQRAGQVGTANATARRILVAIDDNGPGVPEEERNAIFERFRRGQSHQRGTSAQKGTGLGLSLVRAHANLHGGTVWVEDAPEGGARFVLDIAEVEVTE